MTPARTDELLRLADRLRNASQTKQYWSGDDCALVIEASKALRACAHRSGVGERCPKCYRTDAEFKATVEGGKLIPCGDPWHSDDHLRAKSRAAPAPQCEVLTDEMVNAGARVHNPLAFALDDDGSYLVEHVARMVARKETRAILAAALSGAAAQASPTRDLPTLDEYRNNLVEECAKILDDAAADWHRIRDPGMANNAKSYAKKIRALAIPSAQREGEA